MNTKQIVAGFLSAIIILGMEVMPTQAAEANTALVLEDGTYSAGVHMYSDGNAATGDYSMCAAVFAAYADVIVEGEQVTLKLYVANPIPNFSWISTSSGAMTSPKITYDGISYSGAIGVKNASGKYFDKTSTLLGTKAGSTYTCDTLTFTIPKEVLFAEFFDMSGTVKTPTSMSVNFDCVLTDLPIIEVELPTIKEVTIQAFVPVNPTTYTVSIPRELAFGLMNSQEDSVVNYLISVEVNVGGDNKIVEITTDDTGTLYTGKDEILFTNNFGTKHFEMSGEETGTLMVTKEAIAAVGAGDYTGTMDFAIQMIEKN